MASNPGTACAADAGDTIGAGVGAGSKNLTRDILKTSLPAKYTLSSVIAVIPSLVELPPRVMPQIRFPSVLLYLLRKMPGAVVPAKYTALSLVATDLQFPRHVIPQMRFPSSSYLLRKVPGETGVVPAMYTALSPVAVALPSPPHVLFQMRFPSLSYFSRKAL